MLAGVFDYFFYKRAYSGLVSFIIYRFINWVILIIEKYKVCYSVCDT